MPEKWEKINGTLTWYGAELQGAARDETIRTIGEICAFLEKQVKKNISIEGRGIPSADGQFPRKQSGDLYKSIFYAVYPKKLEGIVGTDVPQGLWMEYGTPGGVLIRPIQANFLSWIDPWTGKRQFRKRVIQGAIRTRSFLRRTLHESRSQIAKMFVGKKWTHFKVS